MFLLYFLQQMDWILVTTLGTCIDTNMYFGIWVGLNAKICKLTKVVKQNNPLSTSRYLSLILGQLNKRFFIFKKACSNNIRFMFNMSFPLNSTNERPAYQTSTLPGTSTLIIFFNLSNKCAILSSISLDDLEVLFKVMQLLH